MATAPDPTLNAPRPGKQADLDADVPDMDRPPRAGSNDQPAFDRGTAEADRAARTGGITDEGNPTPPDIDREKAGKKAGRQPPGKAQ